VPRKLVVMNGPHPAAWQRAIRSSPLQLARSWYLFFFQLPWLPELLLGLGGAWPVGNAIRQSAVRREAIPDEDVARLRSAASRPGALRSAIHYYRALFRSRRSLGDWPKIPAPTLVVWAERDVALRVELARDMQAHFSGPYEIRYVADSGHWVQQEQPELVNRALLEFLADLLPAPSA
jgi:pimeloyl-ACP methyl ester carboxylesterase